MLRDQISDALKDAMRGQEKARVSTLRLILAAIKDREIQARSGSGGNIVDDATVMQIMTQMVRQRRESAGTFSNAGRADLANKEEGEIQVIEAFLPRQLDEDEIRAASEAAVKSCNAANMKDMGRTMAWLKDKYAGQMDFAKAGAIVKELLS